MRTLTAVDNLGTGIRVIAIGVLLRSLSQASGQVCVFSDDTAKSSTEV